MCVVVLVLLLQEPVRLGGRGNLVGRDTIEGAPSGARGFRKVHVRGDLGRTGQKPGARPKGMRRVSFPLRCWNLKGGCLRDDKWASEVGGVHGKGCSNRKVRAVHRTRRRKAPVFPNATGSPRDACESGGPIG